MASTRVFKAGNSLVANDRARISPCQRLKNGKPGSVGEQDRNRILAEDARDG